MRSQNIFSYNPRKQGTLILLLPMLILLLLILGGWTDGWASDLDKKDRWQQTINLNWNHYDPIGFATFNLRSDNQLRYVKSFGAGHYFDSLQTGIHLTANRYFESDPWEIGYRLYKNWSNRRFTTSISYQPVFDDYVFSFNGRITKDLYTSISYSTYNQNLNIGGSWKLTDNIRWYAYSNNDQNEWSALSGLNISFSSGNQNRNKSYKREKAIEWLN